MGHSKLTFFRKTQPKETRRMPQSQGGTAHHRPPLEPGAPSDFELMKGIQAGDPDALSQLYDRYNGILKALILRVIRQ